jgi:hypothetical protein
MNIGWHDELVGHAAHYCGLYVLLVPMKFSGSKRASALEFVTRCLHPVLFRFVFVGGRRSLF